MPYCLQQAFGTQTNLRLIPSPSSSSISHWSQWNARFRGKRECDQNHQRRRTRITTTIRAIDHVVPERLDEQNNNAKLKIGIVGFGKFGQFMAKPLVTQGHSVLAHSRSDYTNVAIDLGVSFFANPHEFCKHHPDVIILSTSIRSTRSVLCAFPFQLLNPSTLFVDVLSVKEEPKKWYLELLPPGFDILCAHPMFGPESGKHGWKDLPFVYDKVRIGEFGRCDRFLNVFAQEGCNMVNMSCHEHDRLAAKSQFITHLVGRTLGKMSLESTPINTKGYQSLLDLMDNTKGDSFDLFYGLFMYNENALEQLEEFDMAFQSVKKQLFEQLHNLGRKQL